MRLYDSASSGNAYKVRLLLAQLGRDYERVELDIDRGETRTRQFLAINPNGRVPVLELDDGRRLPESNAILYFLASDTPFLAEDAWTRANTLAWMFFEQYSHEPYIAVSRFILTHLAVDHPRREELPLLRPRGEASLAVMEGHLQRSSFMAGDRYSIADIALYAYTHVAHEGGFDLAPLRGIQAWLDRCRAQPRHIAIDA